MELSLSSSMFLNPWFLSISSFLGYWILCRSLRWRRAAFIANKFKGRDPYSLNIDEAQWIVEQIVQLEMSKISRLSTAFALFRTYGITTIAELLLKTAQLLDIKSGGRRYVDTGVLISEFTSYPFDSERHARAVARMNWIHEQYRISNDDKLYTLSVFVTSPVRWLEKYDWRPLTELEIAAWWIMWREIGHEMNIENIPETYSEIRDWANHYETIAMLPRETNHRLAEITTNLLIYYTPDIMKPFAKRLIIAMMDDRLRNAMLYPPQPTWVYSFIMGFFKFRRVLLPNFHLPRTKPVQYTSKEKNKYGRYNINYADNEPWYLPAGKVGLIQRWLNTLSGIPNPSSEYKMEGYVHEEVGPKGFEGKGKDWMDKEVKRIMERRKEILEKEKFKGNGIGVAF